MSIKENLTMPKRRLRAIDLIQVFTQDDVDDELYGDGPRPPRDPSRPPNIYFSTERPVKKTLYNNTPFGRAVARNYTSDTSTEFETTDEDEYDNEEGHRLGTSLSDDGGAAQNDDQGYCNCEATPRPDIADNNEPGGSVAATTSKINDLTLNDRRCCNCMMYKQENSGLFPERRRDQQRKKVVISAKKPKKKKRRKCQIVRKITGYILEPGLPSSDKDLN